jgi:HEAT repeat protein
VNLKNSTIVLFLLFATAAYAGPLDKLLGARERAPSADDVRALGPSGVRQLIGVATDARTSRLRRNRAILALRHVASAEAREFLRAVLADKKEAVEGADVLDLAAAVTALQPYGREVIADVLPLLTHASADVRHAAVVTLGAMHAPEADNALRIRATVERDPGVRAAAVSALRPAE